MSGAQAAGGNGRRRGWLLAGGLATVLVGLAAGVVVVTDGGGGADPLAPDSILLEPVGEQTPDPFIDENLDLGGAVAISLGDPPQLDDEVNAGLSGTTASGGVPGLNGGSRDAEVCDTQSQIEFLTDPANADKAQAWAEVQDIEVGELADHLGGLAAVRLRFDTRVTNHSFEDGEARPFQSILQAGTAVLVDEFGVPRSKCYCGNPLTPPLMTEGDVDPAEALDVEELAINPEDAWEGFDPAKVVTVTPSPEPHTEIQVAEPETGELTEIPVKAPGDEQAASGYTVDQLEAALPTDDQLRQHFPELFRCRSAEESCRADLVIQASTPGRYDEELDMELGGTFLRIEGYILDPQEVARRLDDQGSETDRVLTPYSRGDWRGFIGDNDVGDACSPDLLVGHENAMILMNLSAAGGVGDEDCTEGRQLIEQYANQTVDALS